MYRTKLKQYAGTLIINAKKKIACNLIYNVVKIFLKREPLSKLSLAYNIFITVIYCPPVGR